MERLHTASYRREVGSLLVMSLIAIILASMIIMFAA
jgi:hypothetical protein